MSRENYAARVRLSARRVAALELGKGWPKSDTLERIARSFNVEVRLIPRKPL
jgi:transcriptional regulator with XRE-family HTH domain